MDGKFRDGTKSLKIIEIKSSNSKNAKEYILYDQRRKLTGWKETVIENVKVWNEKPVGCCDSRWMVQKVESLVPCVSEWKIERKKVDGYPDKLKQIRRHKE